MVLRVKTLGRPKDRAASQILRKPSSIDVRKPTISECQKKKNSFVPWCEREGAFPSPLLSLNPCPPSSSTELLSRLLLFYAVNHFSKIEHRIKRYCGRTTHLPILFTFGPNVIC